MSLETEIAFDLIQLIFKIILVISLGYTLLIIARYHIYKSFRNYPEDYMDNDSKKD